MLDSQKLYKTALFSLCYSDEEYLRRNPDLPPSMPPFTHCRLHAAKEGRSVSDFFDPLWYQSHYSLEGHALGAVEHFFSIGAPAGLKGTENAYSPIYLKQWQDRYFERAEELPVADWPWQTPPGASCRNFPEKAVHLFFVLHETTRTGAPIFAANALRVLAQIPGVVLWTVIMRDGPLARGVGEVSRVLFWNDIVRAAVLPQFGFMQLARGFAALPGKARHLITNTVAVPKYVNTIFANNEIPSSPWIFELPPQVALFCGQRDFADLCREAERLYVPSRHCAEALEAYRREMHPRASAAPFLTLGPAIDCKAEAFSAEEARQFKSSQGIAKNAPLVLGCGAISVRKGADIFVRVASLVARHRPDAAFAWVGKAHTQEDEALHELLREQVRSSRLALRWIGEVPSLWPFYAASSLLFLSSRSDTLPLVALEACLAGLPIRCFEGSGGIPVLFDADKCLALPPDEERMAEAILAALPPENEPPRLPVPLPDNPFSMERTMEQMLYEMNLTPAAPPFTKA